MASIFLFFLGAVFASVWLRPDFYASSWSLISQNNEASAVIFTAVIAAVIAIWGIFSQRAISRRVFTLQYLSEKEVDKDLIEANKTFINLTKEPEKLLSFGSFNNDETDDAKNIRILLNHFELTAIGIQRGVIDFETFKMWHKTGTINTWNKAEPLISALRRRQENPMLYHEFEALAGWLRGNSKPKRGYIIGHWFW